MDSLAIRLVFTAGKDRKWQQPHALPISLFYADPTDAATTDYLRRVFESHRSECKMRAGPRCDDCGRDAVDVTVNIELCLLDVEGPHIKFKVSGEMVELRLRCTLTSLTPSLGLSYVPQACMRRYYCWAHAASASCDRSSVCVSGVWHA